MIKYLLEKEFKQLLRNPMLPRMLLVFPCIILLVLPWAANFEIKNMNLSIVDNDRSPYSTRLVQKVGASEYFHLIDVSNNYQEAMQCIEKGDADLILEIPPHFERDLLKTGVAKVLGIPCGSCIWSISENREEEFCRASLVKGGFWYRNGHLSG